MNKGLVLLALLAIGFAATTQRVTENSAAEALAQEIQRMEGDIRGEQQKHDSMYNDQSKECNDEFNFRNAEVADAQSAFESAQAASARCSNAKGQSESDLEMARNYVSSIQNILTGLAAKRLAEQTSFDVLINEELNPAIAAVDEASSIVRDFAGENTTFVQFSDHLNKIFLHMVKAKQVNKFTEIVAVLIQAPDFQHGISGDIIAQLEQLFNELSDDLNASKDHAIEVENEAVRVYAQTVTEYNNVLLVLANQIGSLTVYVQELSDCITNESQIAAQADTKHRRNADALSHAVDMCSAFDTEYANSTQGRNEELALLAKLVVFVREQEEVFGNYGNDGVNSFEEYQKSLETQRQASRESFMQLKLKQFKNDPKMQVKSAKCDSCRKSFVQKKLGF